MPSFCQASYRDQLPFHKTVRKKTNIIDRQTCRIVKSWIEKKTFWSDLADVCTLWLLSCSSNVKCQNLLRTCIITVLLLASLSALIWWFNLCSFVLAYIAPSHRPVLCKHFEFFLSSYMSSPHSSILYSKRIALIYSAPSFFHLQSNQLMN